MLQIVRVYRQLLSSWASGTLVIAFLQACPHGSVEFRLRPPGIDLWTSHTPSAAELALQFMLLGAGRVLLLRAEVVLLIAYTRYGRQVNMSTLTPALLRLSILIDPFSKI